MTVEKVRGTARAARTGGRGSTLPLPGGRGGATEALLEALIAAATEARKRAYAPYSKYLVGAALATRSGAIFTGCNVENATYGATLCAERSAIAQMVAAGERGPVACAVVTGGDVPGAPCGICRQVLIEFAPDMAIAMVARLGRRAVRKDARLAELLPGAFALRR